MRMTKSLVVGLFISAFLFQSLDAQKPDQILNNWSDKSPLEKVYLHLDRENYIAGETAWFKAYLYSDYQPDTISTVVYVELADASGVFIRRVAFPVLLGTAFGQIDLPENLNAGTYQLRSYTPTMLNIDHSYSGRQSVFIYGKKKTNPVALERKTRIEFFPEGGNLLAGASNVVAFKATNEKGLPLDIRAKLFNSKDEVVSTLESYHDGMGMFDLSPVGGEKYYVIDDGDAIAQKFYIPGATTKAIALSIIPHPQGHFFEINQKSSESVFRAAYMIGQMQHRVVFRQDFAGNRETFQGLINTQKLHSGILQVTFFNKDNQPVAERLCFIDNKEYMQKGKLTADTVSFAAHGKNKFSIQLGDTVRGSFSVSVTDADYSLSAGRENNIFSSLLVTNDLKGYVHNPAWYFRSENDSVKTSIDLLMMTNGWRRFKWEELSQKSKEPVLHKDPAFITLAGKITLRDTKKAFDSKPLMMMMITEDSTRRVQMINTDRDGKFNIDSLLFFGKTRVMFADIRGKKSQYIDAHLTVDTSLKSYTLPNETVPGRNDHLLLASQSKYDADFEKIYKEKGELLEGVTVKSKKKKTALEELDEKYSSGAFATEARKTFDLVNSDEGQGYANILAYLRAKGFSPDFRSTSTISALGSYSAEVYLDEFLAEGDILESLPMSKIAMVKVYSNGFSGSWGNGPGGVIAIYTKKDQDLWNSIDARPTSITYQGFTMIKEFYAPDYSVKSSNIKPDSRITLDWRANILVNNLNPRIPISFYNNDRTKKFKVVVEGMTVDGKMLMIEETISSKGF